MWPLCACAFPTTGSVVSITRLSQVNAIELRLPGPVSGALDSTAGTELLPHGSIIQFISSQGSFRETVPYALRFELTSAPGQGRPLFVRASTHYFENSLPFRERFFFP